MRTPACCLTLLIAFQSQAQVLDVDGDGQVGPQEASALAEQWKGPAPAPNNHNHLGQTWSGAGPPLTLRGNFFTFEFVGTSNHSSEKGIARSAGALVLDNTRAFAPELELLGERGRIAATDKEVGDLILIPNRSVHIELDKDALTSIASDDEAQFSVKSGADELIFVLEEDGDLFLAGDVLADTLKIQMDHPADPQNKSTVHAGVHAPDRVNLYRGNVLLDSKGEAWVQLPSYFEALNTDYGYSLTPLGSPAPGLHVAETIVDNRFRIAGGSPGLWVSWIVTGLRDDNFARSNPLAGERDKPGEEKGRH